MGLALFDFKASDSDVNDPGKARYKARVTRVLPTTSLIQVEGGPTPEKAPLKAVIIQFPTPRLKVRLEGDPQGISKAREALATAGPNAKASLYVREANRDEAAHYRLLARSGQYLIAKPDDDHPLVAEIDGYTDLAAGIAVARLEHIERWQTTAELTNPGTSIRDGEVEVEILIGEKPVSSSEIRLEYTRDDGGWINPSLKIRLKNTGKRTVYVGLLDMPETFGIFPMLNAVECQKLDPGQETFANDGESLPACVPDELWKQGVGEIKDLVKIIISTTPFNARRLAQDDLPAP